MRIAGAVLGLLLLLAGCTSSGDSGDSDEPRAEPGDRCRGVSHDEVRGRAPSYGAKRLRSYPVDHAVCAAYWIDHADDGFVPQGLALRGRTAYVGGYGWVEKRTDRACQVAKVDLRTGRTTGFTPRIEADVYGGRLTFCRHGGGLELTDDGLWLAEAERLWLLDPDRIGRGDPVVRVWRIEPGIKGSTLLIHDGRLGFATYAAEGSGRMTWFALDDVRRPGVDDLRHDARDATDAGVTGRGRVPNRVQGITGDAAGVWHSSSRISCGELHGPGRREVASVPGAEDVQFRGRDLWVVSEAGAEPWIDEERVPMLLRLDRATVLRARSACDF
ncbi:MULTISPECIES: hypothetical protein [unclassified Nocardioides]|uniref:hypothetical protein n=1 Tax=unclassified Nocardioides TaxID=2615069 RepID=UPI0006FEB338|nr:MULTISPECIES: hypothetical protein [unclassified Nocardioides]KQY63668.1 hypothetical protein ASD30_01285 [Nocardioides sp. Root140]KRF15684.1 hypothetical protein ASH02_03280 [Nocardioides sp. Soil796]